MASSSGIIGSLQVVIGANSEALDKGLKNAQGNLQRFSESMSNVGKVAAGALAGVATGVAAGVAVAVKETDKLGKASSEIAVEAARVANALKTVGVAAYALSPAFRSLVNPAIVASTRATGAALAAMAPSVAAVATAMASRLLPALSLVSRVMLPIQAAVLTWRALNHVWRTGADLLEKYADAGRIANITESLKALSKFQTDAISAVQVQRATELGARLQDAKFTIDQFFKVQLDITDPALKLQAAWVTIVESIASATRQLDKFIKLIPSIPGASNVGNALLNTIPGVGAARLGINALAGQAPAEPTRDELLAAARGRLGAAMGVSNIGKEGAPLGGSFDAVFGDMIKQLDDVGKKAEETGSKLKNVVDSSALGRVESYVATINKQSEAFKAELATVGMSKQAHETLRVTMEAESIARERGIEINEKLRAKIDAAAASYGQLAQKVEEARQRWEFVDRSLSTVASGLTDIIMRTKTAAEAFREMSLSIIRDFTQMIIKAQLLKAATAFMEGFGGVGGTGTGGSLLALAGARAGGGPVVGGMPYLVGERGPEIMVPGSSGQVIPNSDIGSGGINIVQHNDFRGVDPSQRAFISAQIRMNNAQLRQQVLADVSSQNRDRPGYLAK